ncbi:MAG: hypothetical protein HRT98_03395 [Mycoplasmatales bacterium]|nr:hypothetical protein [Mycoplasmatales bacterium]
MKIIKLELFEQKNNAVFKRTIDFKKNAKIFWSEETSYGKSLILEAIFFCLGASIDIFKKGTKISVKLTLIHEDKTYIILRNENESTVYLENKRLRINLNSLFSTLFSDNIKYRIQAGKLVNMNFPHLYSSLFIPQERTGGKNKLKILRDDKSSSKDEKEPQKLLIMNESKSLEREIEREINILHRKISLLSKVELINNDDIEALKQANNINLRTFNMLLSDKKTYYNEIMKLERQARHHLRMYNKTIARNKAKEDLVSSLEETSITKEGVKITLADFYREYSITEKTNWTEAIEAKNNYNKIKQKITKKTKPWNL